MLMAKKKHVRSFAEDVRKLFGKRVERVILYGSYAREEEVPGSDIDIAVILDEKKNEDRKKVQEIAEEWFRETGLRFSPRVFEETDFNNRAEDNYSFHTNVQEEGVEI